MLLYVLLTASVAPKYTNSAKLLKHLLAVFIKIHNIHLKHFFHAIYIQ
jgi:hypothetical protein